MSDPALLVTYLTLLVAGLLEGPAVSIFSGYLARLGHLNLLGVLGIFIIADILSDLLYYALGYFSLRHRVIRSFFTRKLADKEMLFRDLWHSHFFSMMFFGKLAYGISVPIIMSAGALQMPLRKFLAGSIPVSVFQTSLLVLTGYLMGEAYYHLIPYIQYPLLVMSVVFAVTFILIYVLKLRTKKYLIK